ncbi:MAG: glycosyltransferase family 4 protein [Microthrixaceae bacterium]|nr:glycosyltransferase family 4 protein [Microthrixaceae bacterium]
MKLLLVSQRYGHDIAGGAEQLLRQFAQRLAARGHHIEVLTSCARSYIDWANSYSPGDDLVSGIPVHRLPTAMPRDNRVFAALDRRVREPVGGAPLSMVVAEAWSTMLGPELPGLVPWLQSRVEDFEAVVFSGYLFRTSLEGMATAAAIRPTVLQPVVHDEPYVRLPQVRALFDHAAGICALTEEEAALIEARFRPPGLLRVVGGGLGPVPALEDQVVPFGLSETPYVVSVGRVDAGKGTFELIDFIEAYRQRRGSDIRLVLVGSNEAGARVGDGVVITGFVDDLDRWTLTSGAEVLVQPSYFESFSLSLAEGWQVARPALVQGRCDVLAGQVRRSGGGLTYANYAEFEVALDVLLENPSLRRELGSAGRRYVQRYDWPSVLDAFESCVEDSLRHWHACRARLVGGSA